jgi:hypothetical protein
MTDDDLDFMNVMWQHADYGEGKTPGQETFDSMRALALVMVISAVFFVIIVIALIVLL